MDPQSFILAVLAHLREEHQLSWVISPKDFDLLRTWSELEIPLPRLLEALDTVVRRRSRAGKPIKGLSTFSYQVDQCRRALVQEHSGAHDPPPPAAAEKAPPRESFMENLPEELEPLRPLLERLLGSPNPAEADREALSRELLERFGTLPWVETRTGAFLRTLPAGFAPKAWADRYRINLLLQHFKIPL